MTINMSYKLFVGVDVGKCQLTSGIAEANAKPALLWRNLSACPSAVNNASSKKSCHEAPQKVLIIL